MVVEKQPADPAGKPGVAPRAADWEGVVGKHLVHEEWVQAVQYVVAWPDAPAVDSSLADNLAAFPADAKAAAIDSRVAAFPADA